MSATILVTGASGFTGKLFIASAMAKGYKCIALNDLVKGDNRVDLTDKGQLRTVLTGVEFDYLVHLAAISFVKHGDLAEIYNVNLVGTLNLLDVIDELGIPVKRTLISSSANVYGTSENACFCEDTQLNPQNDYAASKVAMEAALSFRAGFSNAIITRPFNYTGHGQAEHFLVPKMVKAFREKASILELGNLDVSRDFSDVRDVVFYYLSLLESESAQGTVNICSGKSISLLEILNLLKEITLHDIEIRVNPAFVRSNEVKTLSGNPNRLDTFVPGHQRYDIRDTLRWMLEA